MNIHVMAIRTVHFTDLRPHPVRWLSMSGLCVFDQKLEIKCK